jgi:hypothetical protein
VVYPSLKESYLTCPKDACLNPDDDPTTNLSLRLESVGEAAHVLLEVAVVAEELDVGTVDLDATGSLAVEVLVAAERGEAPVLGDNDLLATGELVLRSAESLKSEVTVRVTSADAHDDLADVDTGDSAVGLAPGTTHTGLQSIGTGARQHLVDTDDVEGVGADAQVETLLAAVLDEVLVGADTGGLEGLRAQLLILVGDEVDAEREVVDVGTLATEIEDANLGVGHTTVEARLGVRLEEEEGQHEVREAPEPKFRPDFSLPSDVCVSPPLVGFFEATAAQEQQKAQGP